MAFKVERIGDGPIIVPHMDDRIGDNINGPSLIRVPEWVSDPLGRYYLYFAHHQGQYIRMAYAEALEGPWTLHGPGVLDLKDAFFKSHIASPDVHLLADRQEIRMYYHGCCLPDPPYQFTHVAESHDGLEFRAKREPLGASYWRAFRWDNMVYTLEMPGTFRRSRSGTSGFEEGPTLFTEHMRHSAVRVSGSTLQVFYSNAHDCPERILLSTIDLVPGWMEWQVAQTQELLTAELEHEGADCPVAPSERGSVHERVHQLRDPCIYEEDDRIYLLYTVAGERGIAIAELKPAAS